MPPRFIAAIDQGTTSSRCMVFDADGRPVARAAREHRQIFPHPGWVEHDAEEIWRSVEVCVGEALGEAGISPGDLAALGITNQRETTLLWDRATGKPLANAIVWQDTRTAELIRELAGDEGMDRFRAKTGLPLATYFSGPKLRWLLDKVGGARARAEAGELCFGTMESWLIWKLTGRHLTEVTNASRTQLMNLSTLDWDDELLSAMGVPRAVLPEIRASSEVYGEAGGVLAGVPVASALGDQQAALFGQACYAAGEGKCTYGTGNFLLVNTGDTPVASREGLLTTVAYKLGDKPAVYGLEGSIAVTGSLVQWLRDNLGFIQAAPEIEALAASVPDCGGARIVPAFSGLFAPRWRPDARGVICGLTGYVTKAHLARAALDSVAWQTAEIVDAMAQDLGERPHELKVDGGMTANGLLMQIQADVLGADVVRSAIPETTCLGAAYAAGLAVGFWPDLETLRGKWRSDARWSSERDGDWRRRERAAWDKAVARSLDWAGGEG